MGTWLGIGLGIFAVFGGAMLEGIGVGTLIQPTSILIVFGGTLGATLVSCSLTEVKMAAGFIKHLFTDSASELAAVADEIVQISQVSRKEGILSIDPIRPQIKNDLFRKAIKFVIDGFEPKALEQILDAEIQNQYELEERAAKVWEQAGGYAPTIGILGAVMGLIHVMGNLNNPASLGEGIAVAFVATVYGVASANLFFLPVGSKLKNQAYERARVRELVKIGVLGIQEGINPIFLKERFDTFLVK